MSSTIDPSLSPLKPVFPSPEPSAERNEPPHVQRLLSKLNLIPNIEGGYFVETDRDTHRVPNPFLPATDKHDDSNNNNKNNPDTETTFYTSTGSVSANLDDKLTASDKAEHQQQQQQPPNPDPTATRNASTTIFYLLTQASPLGVFHRNKGRIIHTLHRGRARYVIIHADAVMPAYDSHHSDGEQHKARVETFVVGRDVERGERLQWIVEGGTYKATYLLEEEEEDGERGEGEGLLITETVVPGFEYSDHDFLRPDRFEALLTKEQADELRWMLKKDDESSV